MINSILAHLFVLLVALIIYAKLHYLILLILAGTLFFGVLFWLCERYPRTMLVLLAFLRGLLGRR